MCPVAQVSYQAIVETINSLIWVLGFARADYIVRAVTKKKTRQLSMAENT